MDAQLYCGLHRDLSNLIISDYNFRIYTLVMLSIFIMFFFVSSVRNSLFQNNVRFRYLQWSLQLVTDCVVSEENTSMLDLGLTN